MSNATNLQGPQIAPRKMTALESGTHRGIRWAVVVAPIVGVNGYVQLPTGHPWARASSYDAIDVEVHGGLTFMEDRWIGFDTAHAGDVWASEYDQHDMSDRYTTNDAWTRHWTVPDVIAETKRLVDAVLAGEQS